MKTVSVILFLALLSPGFALTPDEVINKFDVSFSRIKTAQADFHLDTSLQFFGCGGLRGQNGKLFYKAPNLIKATLDKDTYFLRGNSIRKIDGQGKKYYVRLLNAPDFSVGFNPRLIPYNFNLKLVRETENDILIEGRPKPGVLKNVNKVVFHFDPKEYYLTRMDLSLKQGLSGKININYTRLGSLLVPTATWGKSALELFSGSLIGLTFDLRGENILANLKLTNNFFDPGF